jgi:pyruvate dehydrogenase (quinone)
MAEHTVSDFLAERLVAWNVRRIYGYPGDGINGVMGALGRMDEAEAPQFVQVRHEEMAAFMATAHAKYTGETGVCLATSGPGAIHLLNGLYDAKLDHVPVVAIVGQAATTAMGGSYQQEVDLQTLFGDVCEYVATVTSPMAIRHIVDRAFRIATAMREVTCVIIPKDIQEKKFTPPPRKHNTLHSSPGVCIPSVVPRNADLLRAADALNAGERVAILVGAGALGASDAVVAVADRLGAGVAKALLGKAALPDDLPFVTGTIGLLGTRPSSDMMSKCDTLLMVGTSFPYAEFLPKEGQARGVQIDLDPRNLGLRYATEVNLVGDSRETLEALLPLLSQKTDTSWRDQLAENKREWLVLEDRRARESASPMNPQRVFIELNRHIPDGAILSGDAGTASNWLARNIAIRSGMKSSMSGGLATMGSAVPYAIAAKFAFPNRIAIAMTGDGAMQMNGNAELLTVAKYWQTWSDPRLIFLVLNNGDLNQVTWEMRVMSGDPKYAPSQDLPPFSYAAYAESLGLHGIRVDDPQQLAGAWQEAFAARRPVVFEAIVDPNVAQLPPHISLEEAHHFFDALVKGDPNEAGVIAQSVKGVLAGFVPNR